MLPILIPTTKTIAPAVAPTPVIPTDVWQRSSAAPFLFRY